MDRYIREWLCYNTAVGSFHTKKLCSRLYSIEIEFYQKQKKTKNCFLSHPLGYLGVMYTLYLQLIGKPVVDLFVITELFSLSIPYG